MRQSAVLLVSDVFSVKVSAGYNIRTCKKFPRFFRGMVLLYHIYRAIPDCFKRTYAEKVTF